MTFFDALPRGREKLQKMASMKMFFNEEIATERREDYNRDIVIKSVCVVTGFFFKLPDVSVLKGFIFFFFLK